MRLRAPHRCRPQSSPPARAGCSDRWAPSRPPPTGSPGRTSDREAVALLLAYERASDGRVDGDAAGGGIALDRADQVIGLCLALGVHDVDGRTRSRDARVRLLDDLRASDHLLELIDAAVEEADLLLRLLVLGVVLDVARLERLLQALARLGAPQQRDFEIALELFKPLGREQYRFCKVHLPAI